MLPQPSESELVIKMLVSMTQTMCSKHNVRPLRPLRIIIVTLLTSPYIRLLGFILTWSAHLPAASVYVRRQENACVSARARVFAHETKMKCSVTTSVE